MADETIRASSVATPTSTSAAAQDRSSPKQAWPCAGWRAETFRKTRETRAAVDWATSQHGHRDGDDALVNEIEQHLLAAETAATTPGPPVFVRDLVSTENSLVEAALGHLDSAEATKLRLLPTATLTGHIPSVEAQVCRYLPKADPRRLQVERIARRVEPSELGEADRELLICAFHAAASQRLREMTRLGDFFIVLTRATLCVTFLALALGAFGALWQDALPLCFHPEDKNRIACPTEQTPAQDNGAPVGMVGGDLDDGLRQTVSSADYLVVEVAGLLAAAVAGIATLRRMRGTSTPYRVPIALALLKLPAGAVSAVVGLLLIRGGFVPGLTALDSSAQIVGWAIVFGYAQQLVTGLIDERARGVLDDVGGRGAAGDRPVSTA